MSLSVVKKYHAGRVLKDGPKPYLFPEVSEKECYVNYDS